jgi:hypothetical protein
MMRGLRAAFLVVVALAGCVQPVPSPDTPSGPTLADFLGCPIPGPTGSNIDCADELRPVVRGGLEPGSRCMERFAQSFNEADVEATLWTSESGVFLLRLRIDLDQGAARPGPDLRFHVDATAGNGWTTFSPPLKMLGNSHTRLESIVEVPGGSAAEGRWHLRVHAFHGFASSGPPLSWTDWRLSTQESDDTPWHWVTFASGHRFPIMARSPFGSWVTGDVDVASDEFHLRIGHSLPIDADLTYSSFSALPAAPLDGSCI